MYTLGSRCSLLTSVIRHTSSTGVLVRCSGSLSRGFAGAVSQVSDQSACPLVLVRGAGARGPTLGLPNKPRQSVNEAPAKTSQYPAGAALELSIDMCVLVA